MLLFSVYRCFHWLYRSGHRYFVHLGLRCSLPVLGLRCMRFRDDAKPHRNLNNKYACNLASASPCHPPVKRTEPSRFTDRLLSKEHTGSFSSSMWTKPQRAFDSNSASSLRRTSTTLLWRGSPAEFAVSCASYQQTVSAYLQCSLKELIPLSCRQ